MLRLAIKWWRTWRCLPVVPWLRAAVLYRSGLFDLAEKQYEEGLRTHPEHPASYCARMDLAYCLFRRRDLTGAETLLRLVVSKVPQSREAYIRLAKLQAWTGNYHEAAWTMKQALEKVAPDAEMVALFLMATVENGGPGYLLADAVSAVTKLNSEDLSHPLLEVARAMLSLHRGDKDRGRAVLATVVGQSEVSCEAHVQFATVLLAEGKVAHARRELRQAMGLAPDHPRVLALFAETYLIEGPFYNPDYARQLATLASQNSNWLNPQAMHTLARAYLYTGDKMAALIMASKAKEVGSSRVGMFRGSETLDDLIESLNAGTLS